MSTELNIIEYLIYGFFGGAIGNLVLMGWRDYINPKLDHPKFKSLLNSDKYIRGVEYPEEYNLKTNVSPESKQYNDILDCEVVNKSEFEENGFIIEISKPDENKKVVMPFENREDFVELVQSFSWKSSGNRRLKHTFLHSNCWKCGKNTSDIIMKRSYSIYEETYNVSRCEADYTSREKICCVCLEDIYKKVINDPTIDNITPATEVSEEI